MACHIDNETDSLAVVKLLCNHSFDKKAARIVNADATDNQGRTPLHHAAWRNKLTVCKYLVEEIGVDTTMVTINNEKAIDLAKENNVFSYLAKFQKKTEKGQIKKNANAWEKDEA